MTAYSGQDIAALAVAAGASPSLARIMGACAMSEGGGQSDAAGDWSASLDRHQSWGPFQIHDVHGLSVEQRCDLAFATEWMYRNEFQPAWVEGVRRGYTGEALARWTAMRAERPYGWNGPQDPGLGSPAADAYAAQWRAMEDPVLAYDVEEPSVLQTDDWSCSVASVTWALRSLGMEANYYDLERAELDAELVSTADGLLDGSGASVANWLSARYGMTVAHMENVSWDWIRANTGGGPVLLGAHNWGQYGHWCPIREMNAGDQARLANPAPGYANIWETMSQPQFARVSPCSVVWFPISAEEDPAVIAELQQQIADAQNLLGVIQNDWIDAVISAVEGAKETPTKGERNEILDAALAAAATIKRGGAPAEGEG